MHRTTLSRDSSSFGGMFAIPQGHRTEEGASDDHPIVLTGDTPAEFRNFLWALYALYVNSVHCETCSSTRTKYRPPELLVVQTSRADLTQLVDIARIANKYSFKSVETWSLDAIQELVQRKPSPLLTSIPTSSYTFSPSFSSGTSALPKAKVEVKAKEALESTKMLTQLIRLAHLCAHDKLLTTLVLVLRNLMSLNIQYAYLSMQLADELNIRTLRGAAYLEVLSKSFIVPNVRELGVIGAGSSKVVPGQEKEEDGGGIKEDDPKDDPDTPVITLAQRMRLLSGYYRITHTWSHLRTHPPHFDHSPSCGATWHQPGCSQSFAEFWKEKTKTESVVGLGMEDVIGRLKAVQKEFDRWGSATYMHHDCRMAARRGLGECVRRVEESLPDYFE